MRGEMTSHLVRAGKNHTYLISDGKKTHFFRIYAHKWRSAVEVAEEIRLINLLKSKGLKVVAPVSDVSGAFVQTLKAPEGDRMGVLFPAAEGDPVMRDSEEICRALGGFQANMHRVTHQLRLARPKYDFQWVVERSHRQLQPFIKPGSSLESWLQEVVLALKSSWRDADSQVIRSGIVQLGLWIDHIHHVGPGSVSVFGFDFCGNGWLCLDMAFCLMQIRINTPDEEQATAKAEAFLDAYHALVDIHPEELKMLPMLEVALHLFFLGVMAQRHADWSNVFFSNSYLEKAIRARMLPAYQRWQGR